MMKTSKFLLFLFLSVPHMVSAEEELKKVENPSPFPSIAKPGETFLLKYTFKQGVTKSVISDSTIEFKNQIGTMSMPMNMQVHSIVSIKNSGVDDKGVAQMDVNLDSTDGNMELMGQKQKIPQMMKQNQSDSIKVSALGELLESGAQAATPAMFGPTGPGVTMMVSGLFTQFPENEVSVGESWKKESDVEIPGSKQKMKEIIESSLNDVVEMNGEKVAVVSSKQERSGKDIEIDTQELAKQGAPIPPMAGKITLSESKQTIDVVVYFSLDRGEVVSVQQKTQILTVISGIGGTSQTIKTEMIGDMVMTVTDPSTQEK